MKSVLLGIALAGAAASAAMAQSTNQFDLACTGQVVAEINDVTKNSMELGATVDESVPFERGPIPYTTHLRVDLKAQVFCQDDCKGPEDIALIGPESIIFRSLSGLQSSQLVVNRGDGSFSYDWNEDGNLAAHRAFLKKTATGQCTKVPYTEMPKRLF
jgi:hypothetical protein